MVGAVTGWAQARWRTLRKGHGIYGVTFLLAMGTVNALTRDFTSAIFFVALAAYYAEWQHWQQRCREDEPYADLGRQIMLRRQAAKQRGHSNILITFED